MHRSNCAAERISVAQPARADSLPAEGNIASAHINDSFQTLTYSVRIV